MATESHNLVEVIEFVKVHGLSAHAEIVGRWVWLAFPTTPPADVREAIKAYGFRWIRKRGRWAHNCGHYSRGSIADPRRTYGAIPVDEVRTESLVGAA
jgi:hypothetical protein